MLLIDCPHCGPRSETEFRYSGEAHMTRPAADCDGPTWAAYLFTRENRRGPHAERWRHIHGCGLFFNALRDTATDRVLKTYPAGHDRPAAGGEI